MRGPHGVPTSFRSFYAINRNYILLTKSFAYLDFAGYIL